MTLDASQRSIQTSLQTWAKAEKNQQAVLVDNQGEFHLVYPSVSYQAPDMARDLQEAAKKALVNKIKNALDEWSKKTKLESTQSLLNRIPSLYKFDMTGKLGNLHEEWKALEEHCAQTLPEVPQERLTIFNQFKDLLPAGDLRFEEDGTAILRYDFDTPANQPQLQKDIESLNQYPLDANGYYDNFIKDLGRSEWIIESDTASRSFGLHREAEKLEEIKNALGGDEKLLAVLSKFMNQAAATFAELPFGIALARDRQVVIQPEPGATKQVTFHLLAKDGKIRCELQSYIKVSSVDCDAHKQEGRSWKVNRGYRWAGETSRNNYGKLSRVAAEFDRASAKQGRLKVAQNSQVEALVELRLRPSVTSKRTTVP